MDLGSTIEKIVDVLKTSRLSFNVSEVVKGGSLGHGTAVPGKSDLDLVLYSRDINPRAVIANGVEKYLNEFNSILKAAFGLKYQYDKKTPYALKFTLHTMSGKLDVDLLPSPYWPLADDFIEYLRTLSQPERRNFQCSEAKWIKEFFQQQPNELKEYIRRFKVWKDQKWPKGSRNNGKPKSFLLSLLIVEAYNRVHKINDPVAITKKVKRMVRRHRRFRVHWVGRGAVYSGRYIRQHDIQQEPYILDPANPYNNVYTSGIHGNWVDFARVIGSLNLTQPWILN